LSARCERPGRRRAAQECDEFPPPHGASFPSERVRESYRHPEIQARLAAFRQALEEKGWREGRSVLIDYRFAPAGPDQAQVFAKELVALQPDVLVGNSTPATAALLHETRTIPIVFVGVSDPVRLNQTGRRHLSKSEMGLSKSERALESEPDSEYRQSVALLD
jgi:hypothetical protein